MMLSLNQKKIIFKMSYCLKSAGYFWQGIQVSLWEDYIFSSVQPTVATDQTMVDMTAEHPVNEIEAIPWYHVIYTIPCRHTLTRFIQV